MQQNTGVMQRKATMLYISVVLVWVVVTTLQVIFVNDQLAEQFSVTPDVLRWILALISVPLLTIWLVVLFAIISFSNYADNIQGSADAYGFKYIAYGLSVFLVTSFANSLLSGYGVMSLEVSANPLEVQTNLAIASNYLTAISSLLIYWFLLRGGLSLIKTIKAKIPVLTLIFYVVLPVAIFTALYSRLILLNESRYFSVTAGAAPTFGVPDTLLFATLVLPLAVSWLFGAWSIAAYHTFWRKTKGVIYKPIFKRLVIGLGLVIGLSIILQILTQFSGYWDSAGLQSILALVWIVYAILIFAFWQIGKAAQDLNRIETIQSEVLQNE